ncbi:MAG TPA: SH3-like domain-containing protein [Egicoccus sp.]|nr:SH3-like domain-containing protein [Egicoccus sp.]HSK22276.1 SH3-like domain-containing protein [Egicoccus sp.]
MTQIEGSMRTGQRVRVLEHVADGNPRTPRYLRGWTGTVVRCHGIVDNPLDHHEPYPPLYSVLFDFDDGRQRHDQVLADLHEEWLEPAPDGR